MVAKKSNYSHCSVAVGTKKTPVCWGGKTGILQNVAVGTKYNLHNVAGPPGQKSNSSEYCCDGNILLILQNIALVANKKNLVVFLECCRGCKQFILDLQNVSNAKALCLHTMT